MRIFEGELENAVITIGENDDAVESDKSRQVHEGEYENVNTHYPWDE